MTKRYVEVPAEAIETFLQEKGFTRTVQRSEVVYERRHHECNNLKVKVYTSIRDGNVKVRKCGADAIKVCAVYESTKKSFGVGKFPHVLRTGSTEAVLERTLERMRAAYARCNDWYSTLQVKQVMET